MAHLPPKSPKATLSQQKGTNLPTMVNILGFQVSVSDVFNISLGQISEFGSLHA